MRLSTTPKKRAAAAAYAEVGTVLHACKAAEIDRATFYRWLKTDPEFAAAVELAREDAADRLEREVVRRAVEGVEEPLVSGGKMLGTVTRYSDTLLIFALKGLRPQKYRDNARLEVVTIDAIDAEIQRLTAELGNASAGVDAGSEA